MLDERSLMDTPLLLEQVHRTMRSLLTERALEEKTHKKTKFSLLTEAVIRDEDKEKAVALLQAAYYKVGQNFNKAMLAQALARVFCDGAYDLVKAKTWAFEALGQEPRSFAITDTVGQVYKTILRSV